LAGLLDADESERARWSFGELLRWHMRRGTRPPGSPDQLGASWQIKDLAGAVGYDARSIRNWISGRAVPANIAAIERVLFGDNQSYEHWRREFRSAAAHARGESDFQAPPQRPVQPESSLDRFQSYLVQTPLTVIGYTLFALSIFSDGIDNQLRPLGDLVTVEPIDELRLEHATSFNELLQHLVADQPAELRDRLRTEILNAIDFGSAILYKGSIKSANSAQLSKLPLTLKGFAQLSDRQFHVGLVRMSKTIIVLSLLGMVSATGVGMAAYSGWAAASKLHQVANSIMSRLVASGK
jgi:hypothetical protein